MKNQAIKPSINQSIVHMIEKRKQKPTKSAAWEIVLEKKWFSWKYNNSSLGWKLENCSFGFEIVIEKQTR